MRPIPRRRSCQLTLSRSDGFPAVAFQLQRLPKPSFLVEGCASEFQTHFASAAFDPADSLRF